MSSRRNMRCFLKSRPGVDKEPSVENFGLEDCPSPKELEDGEISVQTIFLSVDPVLRWQMNVDAGYELFEPFKIGHTILGRGGLGVVVATKNSNFQTGDIIQSLDNWPWMVVFNCKPDQFFPATKLHLSAVGNRPQMALSVLGMTGLTAYLFVTEIGRVSPAANQTFVITSAAGAVGNLAGQIAKLKGCKKVIGLCGTDNKCDVLTSELEFDGAINYKTEDVEARLKELCPEGIDIYFDNVGGYVGETIIRQMSSNSHVIVCGQISLYNKDVPFPAPLSEEVQNIMKERNITRRAYEFSDFKEKFDEALKQLGIWVAQGKLKDPEWMHDGLESAPQAFVNMLTGVKQDRVGKQIVRVSDIRF